MWIYDNFKAGMRLPAAWVNQVAVWFNRLSFDGPLSQDRTSGSWTIHHDRPEVEDFAGTDCHEVGPYTEAAPTEGTEAADATTLKLGSAADDKPVRLYAMTRVAYYDAGDKKLYGYVRALTFDAWGHLIEIGPEARVEIDVTGPC